MDFNFYPLPFAEEQSDETIKQLDAQGNRYQIDEGKSFVYYVDIEKGVVAALMKDPLKEAAPIADKTLQQFIESNLYPQFNFSIFEKYLSAPIRAKATCAEEDEFDLSIGMKIARERCLAKYYKKVTNVFVELNNLIDPILSNIEDKIIFYAERYEKYCK
jgi:hypothetical protein